MNSTHVPIRRLQAGQALALAGRCTETLVVVEGELLVQAPAQWIAGTVVLAPCRRVVAPASFRVDGKSSVVAIGRATVVTEQRPGFLARLGFASAEFPGGRRRPALVR